MSLPYILTILRSTAFPWSSGQLYTFQTIFQAVKTFRYLYVGDQVTLKMPIVLITVHQHYYFIAVLCLTHSKFSLPTYVSEISHVIL